jgi:hypothetical protein
MPRSRVRKPRRKTSAGKPPAKPPAQMPSNGPLKPAAPAAGTDATKVANTTDPGHSQPRKRRRWPRIVKWIFGTLVGGTIALLASFYGLSGGPPWPTSPEIAPGMPAYSPAFSIPFDLRNPSSWFSMHRAIVECEIADIKTSSGRTIPVLNTQVASSRDTAIGPLGSRPFQCLFPVLTPGETVVGAKLSIMVQWHVSLFGWWVPSWEPTIGPFNWRSDLKPPRWIKGEPLR